MKRLNIQRRINIQKQVEAWRIEIDSFETCTKNMLEKKEEEKLEQQNENVTNIQFEYRVCNKKLENQTPNSSKLGTQTVSV